MVRQSAGLAATVMLALCAPVACGGGPAASSGIDSTRQVGGLSDADRIALCDWTNDLLGGYGRAITCGGLPKRAADADRMKCTNRLLAFTSCSLVVRDYEICMKGLAAHACDTAMAANSLECQAYQACLGP